MEREMKGGIGGKVGNIYCRILVNHELMYSRNCASYFHGVIRVFLCYCVSVPLV